MPKLSKDHAKQVNDAEGGFPVAEPGLYHLRLEDVDGSRSGNAGPYWSWQFVVVGDADGPCEYDGMKLWNVTSLSEKAAGIMKQTFDAFGVTSDTDTDDLIGQVVSAQVSVRTIQGDSPRAGQKANQIDRLLPKRPEFDLDDAHVEKEKEKIF